MDDTENTPLYEPFLAATHFDQYGNPKDEQDYYCPGCGRRFDYRRECLGKPEAPHKPIDVVSTTELAGDSSGHTPAPNTDDKTSR